MIIILSDREDISTSQVIDWLIAFGQKVLRVHPEHPIDVLNIVINNNITDFTLSYKGSDTFKLSDVSAFWYRRGRLNFRWSNIIKENLINNKFLNQAYGDIYCIEEFLHMKLTEKRSIGNYYKGNANKISILEIAKKNGLEIPATLITEDKTIVKQFREKYGSIINKAIFLPHIFTIGNKSYSAGTNRVVDKDIESMPDTFFLSLFQQEVKKQYEIRVFYLEKRCYSMAIFSQGNTQTQVDFRNYDSLRPNRMIPYLLPKEIENKIINFMEQFGLNCGSLDFIYAEDNKYYFLEVNPVGQFGMTARPCNYPLNETIANYLNHA